ncbi:02071a30-6669-43a9-8a86-fe3a51e58d94 [Thermothielavioides terrestris]|uniref:02071a30-6669-43a9-8a86-fe3a51e58d94 n=1 Tax=Thermothielavioides terrestris TaxID=2587410 RepID=A0A3S4F7D5_9PEZI|nr:02071a30-6669-43a9-8a86-fe3a51e58d94 [Thermothielavioides terrestris]
MQCDLQPNGCGQCLRAELVCHGYRDPSQLAFRDETAATKQKVLARRAAATGQPSPASLQLGWDVRARYAFFSVYIMRLSKSYGALAPLYSRAASTHHLHASVDAVSLAFMACHLDNPALMRPAREKYVLAVQSLGQALRDPQASMTDETLQSVLLLDLYEKMVNRDVRNPVTWMSHVRGAMTLVGARGRRNLSTPLAFELASRVAETLTISYAAAGLHLPEELTALRRALDSGSVAAGPRWDYTAVTADMMNFLVDVRTGKMASPAAVVSKARTFDSQLADLEKRLPASWEARRVYTSGQNPCVFGCYYDVYPTHFATQARNSIWVMRLILNDIVQQKQEPGGPASSGGASTTSAAKNIADITRQICASIPQFILPDARAGNSVPFSPLQRLQCHTLLPKLHLAGKLSTDTHMQSWIIGLLEHIAEVGSIKMARDIANLLRMRLDIDFWTAYVMTGSYALAA